MKKIILFLLIPVFSFGQSNIIVKSIKFPSGKFQTDYDTVAKLATVKKVNDSIAAIRALSNAKIAKSDTNIYSATRTWVMANGALINDGILDWNSTTSSYKPYGAQKSWVSIDTSATNPTSTQRVNINAKLTATQISSGKFIYNSDPSYHQSLTGSGHTFYQNNQPIWYLGGWLKGIGTYSAQIDCNPNASGPAYAFIGNSGSGLGWDGTAPYITSYSSKLLSLKKNGNIEKLYIDSSGGVRLVTPAWDDILVDVTSLKQVGSVDKPDFDNTEIGLLFPDNDTTEMVGHIFQMPHKVKTGTITIYPHVHLRQTTADTAIMKIAYRYYTIGAAIPATWTILTTNSKAATWSSGSIHQILGFSGITINNGLSGILDVKLYRSPADVITGDVLVKQLDIHVPVDKLGSKNPFTD